MNDHPEQEEEQEAADVVPGRPAPQLEALMMDLEDARLEAQRLLQRTTAGIVASITDVATRTAVALRFADIFGWGDPEFARGTFLACCGVDEQHSSSYIVVPEAF